MQDLTVTCGQCGAEIAVNESLAAPLIQASRKEFEKKLSEKNQELRDQAREMDSRREELSKAEAALDETIRQRLSERSSALSEEAERKVRTEIEADFKLKASALKDAEELLMARTAAWESAASEASKLRKEKADLEEEKLRLASTVEDKVGDAVRQARARYEKEKDVELASAKLEMEKALQEELKRKQFASEKELKRQAEELNNAKADLSQREAELAQSKEAEAEFLKAKRTLEEEKRELPLIIQEKVNEELVTSRQVLRAELERDLKLQIKEKDQRLESMKGEIENLRRKSEQGSQQTQGEVWEKEVADILGSKFPGDKIRRIAKGESGADILHDVYNFQGKLCGTLLWESKRTKAWNDDWLAKLKLDQRRIKADTAVIVSHVLPKDMTTFDNREDVWVTGPDCFIAVAGALRHLLIEVASTKRNNEGYKEKATLIYDYVTSLPFRQRVKALVETYSTMQSDLKAERKAITKQWAKREAQLERMIEATGGMYGDLQGIAGQSVPELEGMGFGSLESGS